MPLPLIRLKRIDSTQDFLERHPELGYCGVMADCQLCGRGQRDNRWESAYGAGLWLSASLPVITLQSGLVLQRAMSAVAAVLATYGAPLGLKWPNDLVAWKSDRMVKLGGILGKIKGNRMILGVGVNLWSAPVILGRNIPPSCLKEVYPNLDPLPKTIDLAIAILEAWENLTTHWEPSFYWPNFGDKIQCSEGEGICEGWLSDGRLSVRTMSGLHKMSVDLSK
jgi:BirA family biotin operon repressor/biotin-[acetyl-CoA-carboxylase] ligase